MQKHYPNQLKKVMRRAFPNHIDAIVTNTLAGEDIGYGLHRLTRELVRPASLLANSFDWDSYDDVDWYNDIYVPGNKTFIDEFTPTRDRIRYT